MSESMRLAGYLREHLPACGIPPHRLAADMQIEACTGGHSNLTYLVRFGEYELVVRRPPDGPLPPKAHDVAREYRWLTALHPMFPLAPRSYLLCDDPSVIGSVFCVMERRHGRIVWRDEPPELAAPAVRRRTSEGLVDALARLHAVDVSTGALASLGKPQGFVARQVRGWTERWQQARTSPLPELDAVAAWLLDHLPPDPARPAVVHGDYKLDNVMLAEDNPGKPTAILDWEMAALGDPLVDVGILLAYWAPTSPPDEHHQPVFTTRPGWLTRDEIVERYAIQSGRDVLRMSFYEIFALFKVAIVIQQLYARYRRGHSSDERYARFDRRAAYLAARAAGCISAR